jgi:hypothetical protein
MLVALPMRHLHGHSECTSLSQLLGVLCCLLLAAVTVLFFIVLVRHAPLHHQLLAAARVC